MPDIRRSKEKDVISNYIFTAKPPKEIISFIEGVSEKLEGSGDSQGLGTALVQARKDFAGKNPQEIMLLQAIDWAIKGISDLASGKIAA